MSDSIRFMMWLSNDLHDELKRVAKDECISSAALVRMALVKELRLRQLEKPATKQIKKSQKLDAPSPVSYEEDEIDYSEWE